MRALVGELASTGFHAHCQVVSEPKDVWQALRQFFTHQAQAAAA